MQGLQGCTYEERLSELRMLSLEDRRIRGDAIQILKIVHGKCEMDKSLFTAAGTQHHKFTRHSSKAYNLAIRKCNLEVRSNFFTQRAVRTLNNLSHDVQPAEDLDNFKTLYDNLFK